MKGCKYHSDCLSCPFAKCKFDGQRYPEKLPERLKSVINKRHELLSSQADKHDKRIKRKLSLLSSVRHRKNFLKDIQRFRSMIGIPPEGYTQREAGRLYKDIAGTEIDERQMAAVLDFADSHPLDKRNPMPPAVALELLFYKRPKANFDATFGLCGCYGGNGVFLRDFKTKAPFEIARWVMRKARGENNKYTDCINIVEMFADGDFTSGFWSVIKELPSD